MDTEKLIEEAEALSNAATPGPWCHNSYGVNNWPGPEAPVRVMEMLHNQDDDDEQNHRDAEFIARARTLVPELVTALRETTAREEKQKRQFDEALGNLMDGHAEEIRKRGLSTAETYDACHAALRQTEEERDRERKRADDLAAANVAANKRIEALEHERDEARAELKRLTEPRPISEAPLWMPVNRDSAYGEPSREVLDRHLRNGGLWLVEDSAPHAHRAIFRTWKHPAEDRICWADARGEGLFCGRLRPLLFAPLDIDCNRLPLPLPEVKP